MDHGRSIQAYLRLTYFAATFACLLACVLFVLQWTLVKEEGRVDKLHVPLPSEINRMTLNRADTYSDSSKDFS